EDGIRDRNVTGVQTCALPILSGARKIYIVNRSEERGRMLEELISSRTQAEAQYIFWEKGVKIPEDTDILVQATSLGMEEELPDRSEERRVGTHRCAQVVRERK